jgi:hypothetical protein
MAIYGRLSGIRSGNLWNEAGLPIQSERAAEVNKALIDFLKTEIKKENDRGKSCF